MGKFLKLIASAAVVNLAAGSLAMAQDGPITIGVQVPTTGSEATARRSGSATHCRRARP